MDGFAHFGRPQDLWYIINDVLSSRQLVITPAMLGRASLAFARIAMTPRLSEETRRLANEYTALAHSRAIAMGYDRMDAYMGPRFEVDYVTGHCIREASASGSQHRSGHALMPRTCLCVQRSRPSTASPAMDAGRPQNCRANGSVPILALRSERVQGSADLSLSTHRRSAA
jgi:hypothetical protein